MYVLSSNRREKEERKPHSKRVDNIFFHSLKLPNKTVDSFLCLQKGAKRRGAEREWGEIAGEIRAWEAVQGSLDVYVQRISVADSHQKVHMRAWYESLQEIGGLYYGNNFSTQ